MDSVKRLKGVLISEIMLTIFGAGMSGDGFRMSGITVLIIVLQGVILVYMAAKIIKPLKMVSDILDSYIENLGEEAEMKKIDKNLPYMEQIQCLLTKYASWKTRKNSAEIFDKQTELTALQSQINPHFLYNTLDSIRGQALMDDNYEIARMVEALGAFFRYSISRTGSLVTLRDELANINNYMLIQSYRFNNRFSIEIIIDDEDEAAYDFLIPKLIIQPVVENAIFHGLEEKLEGGKVSIEIIVTEKNLIIIISDNGKGIESERLKALNKRIQFSSLQSDDDSIRHHRNTGIALPNIHKRIQLLFGEDYGVNIYSTAGQGTNVEITIPANYTRRGSI